MGLGLFLLFGGYLRCWWFICDAPGLFAILRVYLRPQCLFAILGVCLRSSGFIYAPQNLWEHRLGDRSFQSAFEFSTLVAAVQKPKWMLFAGEKRENLWWQDCLRFSRVICSPPSLFTLLKIYLPYSFPTRFRPQKTAA